MKEMFSISSGAATAKLTPVLAPNSESTKDIKSDDKSSSSKDFFSILFSNIKETLATAEDTVISEVTTTTKILDEDAPKKTLDEHLLDEVLELVSILKTSTSSTPSFPSFSNKIEKLLSNETALKELKSVDNLTDLLKLSKKYDLGLEKISIQKLDLTSLKSEFPTLNKNFFEITKEVSSKSVEAPKETKNTTEIKSNQISLRDIQKPVQKSEKVPSLLEKAMSSSNSKEELQTVQVNQKNDKVLDTKPVEIKDIKVLDTKPVEIKDIKVLDTKPVEIKDIKVLDTKTAEVIKNIQESTPKVLIGEKKKDVKEKILKEDLEVKQKIVTGTEEIKISDTTRVNETKVESYIPKKGLIENILQNIKTQKSEQTNRTNTTLLVDQTKQTDDSSLDMGEQKNESVTQKIDLKSTVKTEVSTNKSTFSARDTFNNFANDLKDKMQNYKPPLMKLQMALNPKELGAVDVVLINRGNSLHVSITSNTNSMTLFTQNQAEFKNSLVNMGFTNLEMNFSDQRESKGQQNSNKSSQSFDKNFEDENIEEGTTSIELVVPQYV